RQRRFPRFRDIPCCVSCPSWDCQKRPKPLRGGPKAMPRAASESPPGAPSPLRRRPGLLLPASFHSPAPGPAPPRDDGGSGWTSGRGASRRRGLPRTPLRRRMTEALTPPARSPKTIRLPIHWVADFARHLHASPDRLGPEHVRSYPLHLIQERKVPCYV